MSVGFLCCCLSSMQPESCFILFAVAFMANVWEAPKIVSVINFIEMNHINESQIHSTKKGQTLASTGDESCLLFSESIQWHWLVWNGTNKLERIRASRESISTLFICISRTSVYFIWLNGIDSWNKIIWTVYKGGFQSF